MDVLGKDFTNKTFLYVDRFGSYNPKHNLNDDFGLFLKSNFLSFFIIKSRFGTNFEFYIIKDTIFHL